jgi:AAA+ superfamily predicted ATPase
MEKWVEQKQNQKALGNQFASQTDMVVNQFVTQIPVANAWLSNIIAQRIGLLNSQAKGFEIEIPAALQEQGQPFFEIVNKVNGQAEDYVTLAVVLASKLHEQVFAPLMQIRDEFPQVGGEVLRSSNEFIPTLRTLIFLLNGLNNDQDDLVYNQLMNSELFREGVVELIEPREFFHPKHYMLKLTNEYYKYLSLGKKPTMGLTPDFPAQQLITSKKFDDLILRETSAAQLEDVINYAKYHKVLQEDESVSGKLKNGMIALFWGPPGTGKSLTASVIANELGIEAYRVDLSRIVSKYIGETEKNLERVFYKFENKDCILFFDEADALFGKRSEVKDAKDRYANQEISYLLQRVESFNGIVILASNLKEHMDEAFKRRVLSWVFFPRPDAEERKRLWEIHLPDSFEFENEAFLTQLSEKYELTGSHIGNVMKLSCIRALSQDSKTLTATIVEPYIADIYKREGINRSPQRTQIRKR